MDAFAHELYQQITIKKNIDPEDLSRKIGVAMDTIYRYDRDDIKTPLFRARQIVATTGRIELARAMLDGTGFIPVESPNGVVTPDGVERDEINVLLAAGDSVRAIQKGLEDGVISNKEMIEIGKALDALVTQATSLKLKIGKLIK